MSTQQPNLVNPEQTTDPKQTPTAQGGNPRQRGGWNSRGRGFRNKRRSKQDNWEPKTKLGKLVKFGKIKSIDEIYFHSLPIKEVEIIDMLCPDLYDEVLNIRSVQKQTTAGQRTRFSATVVVGDKNGHIGLGTKVSKEVAGAIHGAITIAKLSLRPVLLGYWGSKSGVAHTVPMKVTGKCGSVICRLIPAPRGTRLIAGQTTIKILSFAGVTDCYSNSTGHTRTLINCAHAAFNAVTNTYSYLSSDVWGDRELPTPIYEKHKEFFRKKLNPRNERSYIRT